MRQVTQAYKDAVKSLGRELSVRIRVGDNVYSAITNCNYYTENEPFKSSMSCLTLSVKGISSLESNFIDSLEIGVKVTGEMDPEGLDFAQYFEYTDYGAFYITEKEYNVETNSLQLTCYDYMYYAMAPYKDVDNSNTEKITLLEAVNLVCSKCGFEFENTDLPNADITFKKTLLNDCSTYRDVLDAVAGVACVNFKCDGTKLKIVDWSESDELITPSEMKTLKIGDKIIAPDIVDFAGVISTVRIPVNAADSDNKLIIENNPIIFGLVDNEDTASLTQIYNRLVTFNYYTYETDTIGFTYLELGDKVIITDLKGDEYPVVIMNVNLTINQGMTETFSADRPTFSPGDYSNVENLNSFVTKDHIMQKTFTRKDGATATIKFGYVSGSENANYIHMIDTGGGEYPYAVKDDGTIECLQVISQKPPQYPNQVLWSGTSLMSGDDFITFTKESADGEGSEDAYLSEMTNGIVLVFSRYVDGKAVNHTFSFHFIPKDYIECYPFTGCNIVLASEMFTVVANKYLYISDTGISGKDSNIQSATSSSGIKYNNGAFALRMVMGI